METVESVENPEVKVETVGTVPNISEIALAGLVPTGVEPTTSPKFEYEFTFMLDGKPMFVTLWDTDDRSACERVVCHPVAPETITFSDTGNGFVTDKDGFRWSFHKEPYRSSYGLHNEISAEGSDELHGFIGVDAPRRSRQRRQSPTADAILAGL